MFIKLSGNMEDLYPHLQELITVTIQFIPKILLAIVLFFAGNFIIKQGVKQFSNLLTKREVDVSLIPFLSSIIRIALSIMLLISVASVVGIPTTSFVAVLGAAGLAIGLALQGSLSNFAGGVLILFLKPFKVGDVIEAQGVIASVTSIQIFYTSLKTFDHKVIIMPNGQLSNGIITNYSREKTRVVEWVFGVGYNDDIDHVRSTIVDIVYQDSRVLNTSNPFVHISAMAESSINFKVRAEVLQEHYWDVFFDINRDIKKAFDQQGISIPFPQRDIHIFQATPKKIID